MPAVGIPIQAFGLTPLNSSAPISGAKPLGRESPSISVATPTDAPPDSSKVLVDAGMCRSVADVNGAAAVLASEALSFVPTAFKVLVYALRLVDGVVVEALKLLAR